MYEQLIVWLDFDGTVVEHAYPDIGLLNPDAPEVIEKLRARGHRIILNTTRVDFNNGTFEHALGFMQEQGLEIDEYSPQKLYPLPFNIKSILDQHEIFIDDMAMNIPLIPCRELHGMMVDWASLRRIFIEYGIIDA